MSKIMTSREAAAQIRSGDRIMISGFGVKGYPAKILQALCEREDVDDLIVYTNAPNGTTRPELEEILNTRCKRMICTFMRSPAAVKLYSEGKLDIMPQGNFSQSLRMGGAGIPAYYTPVGVGTPLEEGREVRDFDGKRYILEPSITGEVALFRANIVDRAGNCYIKGTTKNFSPMMALACKKVFVEAEKVVEVGEIDPELVTVQGILVTGIVEV